VNPLRGVLEEVLDCKAVRGSNAIKLFISATNVETGRVRVFEHHEITIDALLASACLPFTFQAVEIEGRPYWDGGYMGNPAIFPLIYGCDSSDVVVVQINPLIRFGTPQTAIEIVNRLNEISFNSSLMAEMRAIAFVQKLIGDDHLMGTAVERYKNMHVHQISADGVMRDLGAASKMNAELDFLLYLRHLGRQTAETWLEATWSDLNVQSSVDIKATFL
jgi:NTE family protein